MGQAAEVTRPSSVCEEGIRVWCLASGLDKGVSRSSRHGWSVYPVLSNSLAGRPAGDESSGGKLLV